MCCVSGVCSQSGDVLLQPPAAPTPKPVPLTQPLKTKLLASEGRYYLKIDFFFFYSAITSGLPTLLFFLLVVVDFFSPLMQREIQ